MRLMKECISYCISGGNGVISLYYTVYNKYRKCTPICNK